MSSDAWQLPAPPLELAARLESAWRDGIPLAAHMGATVAELEETGLSLGAPLSPNVNHMGTGFAGSIATLATLTGWGVCKILAFAAGDADVVIQRSEVRYLAPVTGDMTAYCAFPEPGFCRRFAQHLERRGRARIRLVVEVRAEGRVCAELEGDYVAVSRPPPAA